MPPSKPLVSITNCVHTEPAESSEQQSNQPLREARTRRYGLQRIAQQLLAQVPHPRPGQTWRTLRCLQHLPGAGVAIRYTPEISRASFAGSCICGSVWVCPVCSARICELRRVEIAAAHSVHSAAGGSALMLTLTVPHDLQDSLRDLLGRRRLSGRYGLAGAVQRFWNDRATKGVVELLGRVGFVKATEITRGPNGWHPHFHQLWLTTADQDDRVRIPAQAELLRAWRRSCLNSGLDEPNHRGVDLRWAWDASEYLSKVGHEQAWGAARELVAAGTKRARAASQNPWQILSAAADGEPKAVTAFGEYATATLGIRQLVWSRGLKAALSIEEQTDEQLAQHVDETSFVLTVIPAVRWRALLALPFEWRSSVLDLAEDGGPEAVHQFLDLLEVDPESARALAGIP